MNINPITNCECLPSLVSSQIPSLQQCTTQSSSSVSIDIALALALALTLALALALALALTLAGISLTEVR